MRYEVEVNGRLRHANVHRHEGRFVVTLDGRDWTVDAVRVDARTLSLLIERAAGQKERGDASAPPARMGGSGVVASHEVTIAPDAGSGQLAVRVGTVPLDVSLNGRRRWGRREDGAHTAGGPQRIVAPMPGKVVRLLVKPGDRVNARQAVVVIEAMKMENELRASAEGVVAELPVQEGQSVDAGTLVAVVGPA